MKVTDIQWDVENKEDLDSLPTKMEVPEEIVEEVVSDYITEQTGFCHKGFLLEPDIQNEYGLETLKEQILNKKLFGYVVDFSSGGKGIVSAENETEAVLKIKRAYMKKDYTEKDLTEIEVWKISIDLYDEEYKVLEIFE